MHACLLLINYWSSIWLPVYMHGSISINGGHIQENVTFLTIMSSWFATFTLVWAFEFFSWATIVFHLNCSCTAGWGLVFSTHWAYTSHTQQTTSIFCWEIDSIRKGFQWAIRTLQWIRYSVRGSLFFKWQRLWKCPRCGAKILLDLQRRT